MKLLHTSLALGSLSLVNAQSRIFLEQIYFWFASPDAWDAANSGCTTDADCPSTDDKPDQTCGLMEYLDLTSVQVTDWAPETRVKQCMNKNTECNKQLLHKYSGYRILTFCGDPMATRLETMYVKDAHYFNMGVSDYQCIGYNVGKACKDPDGHAGTCVMLETQNAQQTKVADFPRVQRQTLHTICLPKMEESEEKITEKSGQAVLQKNMKFALSGIRLKNYELRMMNNNLVFCDKVSGQQTLEIPPLGSIDYETVEAFLDVDIPNERLQEFKVSGPCPTVGVGTKISYIDSSEESNALLLVVQTYFEQMYLRRYFYFPFFLLVCISLLCLISYGFVWLGHVCFISKRDKKRNARLTHNEGGRDHGARAQIKDADVKWPNTAEGKGWKIADYEKEMKQITELPEESPQRLDRFANLFSKALDLIVTALSSNRTIPHAIFRIRDAFAREICDCELVHVLEHVDALVAVTQREQRTTEALTDKETKEVQKLKQFFEGELKARAPRPDLQELPNFQSSALYQDRIGQRLLNHNQYSLALFLRMYIQERFSAYKETIGQRFKDEQTQPKCVNWSVKNDFQKNAVQIWQHYTDYRREGFFISYRAWMINIMLSTSMLVAGILVLSALVGIICLGTALREQTLSSSGWIIIPLLLCGLLWWGLGKLQRKEWWDLAAVDDLVQGSIEAPVGELQAAYLHFKGMPQIEIVEVKESLEEFQKVTVNYVYNQAFVGEMDFRFRPWTQVYHAKLFLQEISGAKKPIEVLQSLNYMEIFLSLNEQLDTDETAAILQERPQYKEDSDAELDLDAIEYTAKAQGDRAGSVFKGYTRPGEAGSLEMQGLKEGDEDSYAAQIISNDIREGQQQRTQIVKKTTVTKTSNQIIS